MKHRTTVKWAVALVVAAISLSALSTATAQRGGPPEDVTNLRADALDEGNLLTWDHPVAPEDRDQFPNEEDPAQFLVYRQANGEEGFTLIAELNARTTEEHLDHDVEQGVTYTYAVVYHDGVPSCDIHSESESPAARCPTVEVTAIPFFGAPILAALAAIGSIGAYGIYQRRK